MSHSDFSALGEQEVAACPECDASTVRTLSPGSMAGPIDDTKEYYCHSCSATFDEFVVREPHGKRNTQSGLAKDLLDADPDEVSRE